jgi:filamentous hemagglutinin family protein
VSWVLSINLLGIFVLQIDSALCQITPDATLGSESSVVNTNTLTNGGKENIISGGATRGTNLFHSLKDFSIESGSQAYFENPSGIRTIISRITGSSQSLILGKLGVLGSADLFFINPNGIIFGNDSSLDLNGSLFISTANSINFSDGFEFNAEQGNNILEINGHGVPQKFIFNSNAPIIINGNGHNLSVTDITLNGIGSSFGLNIAGKGFYIYGGDVFLNAGVITNASGNIQIGGVKKGEIQIQNQQGIWNTDYSGVLEFGSISLSNRSLIDISGPLSGNISLFGNSIFVNSESVILSSTSNSQLSGTISLFANDKIVFSNESLELVENPVPALILSLTYGGEPTNIEINTNNLDLLGGANIFTNGLFNGNTGNIVINANNIFLGEAVLDASFNSKLNIISTIQSGLGKSGNIVINTRSLKILEGGGISTVNFGTVGGGNIFVFASDYITVDGRTPDQSLPSIISSLSFSQGNAGDIKISTPNFNILNGAIVSSLALTDGSSGDIEISTNNLNINGGGSGILSSATTADPVVTNALNLSPVSGSSGNINIKAQTIRINDGGIGTINTGTGNAGTVTIDSKAIALSNGQITASAGLFGNGGNININTIALAGDRSSQIVANAQQGQGGNININTQGLLFPGTISATSEAGVQGEVRVNAQERRVDREIENTITPAAAVFPISCEDTAKNSGFTTIGTDQLTDEVLDNIATISEYPKFIDDVNGGKIEPYVTVRGWVPRKDGKLQPVVSIPAIALDKTAQNNLCKASRETQNSLN